MMPFNLVDRYECFGGQYISPECSICVKLHSVASQKTFLSIFTTFENLESHMHFLLSRCDKRLSLLKLNLVN